MTDRPSKRSDRPSKFDGEDRQTDQLAPENENDEQEDEGEQAQTVAGEALTRGTDFGLEDSEKVSTGGDSDVPDLVDRMEQMASSGHIDMDAYAGEPNDDDEDEKYGTRRRGRRRNDVEDDDDGDE